MSIRRSSLICVAYLQVYERVADNRWWPNIGGLLYLALVCLYHVLYDVQNDQEFLTCDKNTLFCPG